MESRIAKYCLIISFLFALPIILTAQASTQTITLWTDADQSHCEFYTDSANVTFDIFVILDTGAYDAGLAEYQVSLPDKHLLVSDEPADFINIGAVLGVPVGAPGISAPFLSCQNGLVVLWRMTCTASDVEPAAYWLLPNGTSDFLGIGTCPSPDFVPAVTYNCFGYNHWCGCSSAVEENSWGAIKAIYK